MKAIEVLDRMLDKLNELTEVGSELEDAIENGAEMLAVTKLMERINKVEIAVAVNRSIFEQRLNNKGEQK